MNNNTNKTRTNPSGHCLISPVLSSFTTFSPCTRTVANCTHCYSPYFFLPLISSLPYGKHPFLISVIEPYLIIWSNASSFRRPPLTPSWICPLLIDLLYGVPFLVQGPSCLIYWRRTFCTLIIQKYFHLPKGTENSWVQRSMNLTGSALY